MSKQLVLMGGEQPRPRRHGLLDERTKELCRLGVLQARAALREASRRASARDAAQREERELELARRAAAARRAAQRRLDVPAPAAGGQTAADAA